MFSTKQEIKEDRKQSSDVNVVNSKPNISQNNSTLINKTENSKVSVLHLNIRSSKPHFDKLEALILSPESPPDIICITETWLTKNDPSESWLINGYNHYFRKNRETPGGGVMIQARKTCCLLNQLDSFSEESLTVDILKNGYKFSLCVIYNPPKSNKMQFIDRLDEFLENSKSANHPFILCGDLNIDIIPDNLLSQNYLNCIHSNGFSINGREPTRVTATSSICLDHFIFGNLTEPHSMVLNSEHLSDHYPILLEWVIKCQIVNNEVPFRDTSFLKSRSQVEEFLKIAESKLASHKIVIFEMNDADAAFKLFAKSFEEVLNMFAPLKTKKKLVTKQPARFTNKLKNLRTKRNNAHKKWKLNQNDYQLLQTFRSLRDRFEKEIKLSKENYYWNKFKNCIGDSRQTYKILNDISGKSNKNSKIPPLQSCIDENENATERCC